MSVTGQQWPSPALQQFTASYCIDCHGEKNSEGNFSISTLDTNIRDGDHYEQWRLVLEQLQFGDMPPDGARQPAIAERKIVVEQLRSKFHTLFQPGTSPIFKLQLPAFGNHVDHTELFDSPAPRVTPSPPRLWRIRPEVYNTTMPRLAEKVEGLANALTYSEQPEFRDYSALYFIDEASAGPLLDNAKKIASQMVSDTGKDKNLKQLAGLSSPPGTELLHSSIKTVFYKVLGRNPTPDETHRYSKFYTTAYESSQANTAVIALISAVLLQPEALFRQELGDGSVDQHGRTRLSQLELAFALSFAVSNIPQNRFMEAAKADKLKEKSEIVKLLNEQLALEDYLFTKNPRIITFFREYFGYQNTLEVFKDQPEDGNHNPSLLVADLEANIADILHQDQNVLKELLTFDQYYVNASYKSVKREGIQLQLGHIKPGMYHTAYGLARDWKWSLEKQPVKMPENQRAGVLTHPAWLTAWSGNFENHPVQRGKWIRTHLLGGNVPDVPIGVDARIPVDDTMTLRERLAIATSDNTCWRCHRKMDDLGVPFEQFDHYGRFQRFEAGKPVEVDGAITRTGLTQLDRTFDSPIGLMAALSESEYVTQVFIRHAFRFFLGRNETIGDAKTLQDAYLVYKESRGSFRQLVISLLTSDSFLLRQIYTEEQEENRKGANP